MDAGAPAARRAWRLSEELAALLAVGRVETRRATDAELRASGLDASLLRKVFAGRPAAGVSGFRPAESLERKLAEKVRVDGDAVVAAVALKSGLVPDPGAARVESDAGVADSDLVSVSGALFRVAFDGAVSRSALLRRCDPAEATVEFAVEHRGRPVLASAPARCAFPGCDEACDLLRHFDACRAETCRVCAPARRRDEANDSAQRRPTRGRGAARRAASSASSMARSAASPPPRVGRSPRRPLRRRRRRPRRHGAAVGAAAARRAAAPAPAAAAPAAAAGSGGSGGSGSGSGGRGSGSVGRGASGSSGAGLRPGGGAVPLEVKGSPGSRASDSRPRRCGSAAPPRRRGAPAAPRDDGVCATAAGAGRCACDLRFSARSAAPAGPPAAPRRAASIQRGDSKLRAMARRHEYEAPRRSRRPRRRREPPGGGARRPRLPASARWASELVSSFAAGRGRAALLPQPARGGLQPDEPGPGGRVARGAGVADTLFSVLPRAGLVVWDLLRVALSPILGFGGSKAEPGPDVPVMRWYQEAVLDPDSLQARAGRPVGFKGVGRNQHLNRRLYLINYLDGSNGQPSGHGVRLSEFRGRWIDQRPDWNVAVGRAGDQRP
ncbi:hypothetical protein JL722_2148 [Aureococcus anophagefferens]|nr:hypothetical protein JL722_2148 [Aureococcus anophagefferens]